MKMTLHSITRYSLIVAAVVQTQAAGAPLLAAESVRVASAPYRASVSGAGNSFAPVLSADGRFVAFLSHANNLVTNDDLGPHLDLFLRDLVSSNTTLLSVSTNGYG